MKRKRDGVKKRDMVLAVSEKIDNVTQQNVGRIIDCFIEEIKKQYRNNKTVELRGFGTFFPHHKDSWKCFVPSNDRFENVSACTKLKFKASRKMIVED